MIAHAGLQVPSRVMTRCRMRKKAVQQGRIEVRDAKKNERHVCGRARVGERPVSQGRIVLLRYGEPLRFTPRGITRGTLVNAAEPVRRPCLARTPLADFFRIRIDLPPAACSGCRNASPAV